MMTKILALDLGRKTGIACNYGLMPGAFTKTWGTEKEERSWARDRLNRRQDPRVLRFFNWLSSIEPPDIVVFEDVEFSTYTYQTQLWAAFRTAVWLSMQHRLVECVPVSTLKKFATGSGAADKRAMKKALFTRFPEMRPDLDDNAIDAMWLLKWAELNLGRTAL